MRTQTVNIDEAKSQLADLIAMAAEGGEILIVDNGKALARLVPPATQRLTARIRQPHVSSPATKTLCPGMLTVGRTSREARRDSLVHVSTSRQASPGPDSYS